MIKLENINFTYPDGTRVFENFSFDFKDNEITFVLGESGAGKTTLLNILGGLLKVDSGKIINESKAVSYVFQEPRLIEQKTVFQNLDYVLKVVEKNKAVRRQLIMDGLKTVGLSSEDAKKYPSALSGGMAQRVALLRAFLIKSDLLLMDEPFKGLNKSLKDSIIDVFLELYRTNKRTVVFVTHNNEELQLKDDSPSLVLDKNFV